MRIIESYSSGPGPVAEMQGRTYPLPSLIEDDEDGIRWLLTDGPEIHAPLWARASAAGAAGLLAVLNADPRDFKILAVTTERFAEHRTEQAPNYLLPMGEWGVFDHVPTYTEVYQAVPGKLTVVRPSSASPFVHGHTHSEYSPLDGLSKIQELVDEAVKDNQPGLALTDHGRCSGHPELQLRCDQAGIQPIFGIEAYFVNDRLIRPESMTVPEGLKDAKGKPLTAAKKLQHDYWHLILWAMDDKGLENLWAMSTESFRDGFYYHPRMDWDTLRRHSEGIMAASGCLRGPLSVPILNDDEEQAKANLGKLLDIYGDRFYLEVQPNALAEQEKVNRALVGMGKDFGVPLMATVDSHYPTQSDHEIHEAWIAVQTNSDISDEGDLFAINLDLYMQTQADVRKGLAYLGQDVVDEAVKNTNDLVTRTNARIGGKPTAPVYSKTGGPDQDARRLLDLCTNNWGKIASKPDQDGYIARFEREFALLRQKGFTGYFLMVSNYCLDPSTPVLTEDMRWVEVGKLEVGDKLAGFDEHKVVKQQKGHRYWHSAEVVDTRRIVLPTYKVVLADGTETITSEDHQWLVASPSGSAARWIRTKDLRVGQRAQRLVPEWDEPNTWEAGYLAGILDGEGSLSTSKMKNGGRTLTLSFAQKEGMVLDTSLKILDSWGFNYHVKDHGAQRNGLRSVSLRGGRAEVMRLLGMVRPQRLLAKLDVEILGRVISIDSPAIVGIESLGMGEVVALETTTGTLVAQGFAHHNCRYAKANGILVGPGRGSGAGSLVAYLSDITEVDPIEAKLPFERFMTEGRVSLPDFDVDFPASKKEVMLSYLADKYGADHIIQIGTHLRLRSKGTVKDLGRALMSVLVPMRIEDKIGGGYDVGSDPEKEIAIRAEIHKDLADVSKIIEGAEAGTAGLGMPWDDLWNQFGDDLNPYRQKYPDLFSMSDRLVGRLKSYGKHAAGVVISTDRSLHDWLPLMTGEGGRMVSQFDMVALEAMGLVKFDILTIRTLDTIQAAVDLIRELRQVDVDVYAWDEEYRDPAVWEEICDGNTLGMFQIETKAGTRLATRMKPTSMQELADMNTIVRPGPMRSGLTDTYLRRRNGEESVTYDDVRLEEITGDSQGCPIYQDHVLELMMKLAGYSSDEADEVRKILGKKKVEKIAGAGQEFVQRAREWGGMDREVAQHLWDQLAEFAKYGFNKAHAYSYSMISYWTAWLKIHYPVEFFVAALSTIEKNRIPEFIKEVRRAGYTVLPPDINASGKGFKAEPLAVRYGLDAIKGIGDAAVDYLIEGQLYTSFDQFDAYTNAEGTKANAGVQMMLARIGALDSLEPRRAALVKMLTDRKNGADTRCVHRNDNVLIPLTTRKEFIDSGHAELLVPDGCGFDWDSEPQPVNARTGKKLKRKPPPKKCTKACRRYQAPPKAELSDSETFSDEDIRTIEHELLGVFLSSTPFDKLHPDDRTNLYGDAERLPAGGPGYYTVAAILMGIRKTKTRASQEEMAFLTLDTEVSTVDAVAFPKTWIDISTGMHTGQLCLVVLEKQDGDRGLVVREYMPVSARGTGS